MREILIICLSNLKHDPRVKRQIAFLNDKYKITTLGFTDPEVNGVDFYKIEYSKYNANTNPFLLFLKIMDLTILKNYEKAFWKSLDNPKKVLNKLKNKNFDLIIANDITAMPLVTEIKKTGTKIIFDAHEYYPELFQDNWKWRIFFKKQFTYLCDKYIPIADKMLCTSESMSKEYKKYYDVNPVVITNAPEYEKLPVTKVNQDKVKIIHHGGFKASRHIEILVEMMEYLDERFNMDLVVFMPTSDKNYVKRIKKMAKKNERISFIPPVPMPDISREFNKYDIGIHTLMPVNLNHKITIPNKFFEYVQSRLMIVASGGTEMARLVNKYNCGITFTDFTARNVADKLNTLTIDDIIFYKKQSHKNAKELSSMENKKTLIKTIETLINN